jgi:3-isopropylmalate/(R)-2-methylmalate dehydratase large subunit
MQKTLFDKIWDQHVVHSIENGPDVLYIDKHFIHEVTSPQAFAAIEKRGLQLFRPKNTVATADHNVPTTNQHLPIKEELSRKQVNQLIENCGKHNVTLYGLGHEYQGIVHIIGPELGLTLPGMTIVCGDSHTSTHGAFGSIAFGIGTSEVEQVFASQCILQPKPKTMKIEVNGTLKEGVLAKDVILYIISKLSSSGATGYFIEYTGTLIRSLSMEARMTICNMSIEMGARGGLIAPDETTFEYIKGRTFAPQGEEYTKALEYWKTLVTDKGAKYDVEHIFDAVDIAPMITFGTNPGMGMKISESIPEITANKSYDKSLEYMGFKPNESISGKKIQYVFIGSCTNGRIEDLRIAAEIAKGKHKSKDVTVWIVPGSKAVEKQAIEEGLDKIFKDAGFEFREPGCSACLGMNEDKIPAGSYCVSTSNRNFEGRQGPNSKTLLASPLTAAIAAITGEITDFKNYKN